MLPRSSIRPGSPPGSTRRCSTGCCAGQS
jgi:hypothetical protein